TSGASLSVTVPATTSTFTGDGPLPGAEPGPALSPRSAPTAEPAPPSASNSAHRRRAADTSTAQQASPASKTRSENPPTATGPAGSGIVPLPRPGAGRSTAAIQPAYAEPPGAARGPAPKPAH